MMISYDKLQVKIVLIWKKKIEIKFKQIMTCLRNTNYSNRSEFTALTAQFDCPPYTVFTVHGSASAMPDIAHIRMNHTILSTQANYVRL